MAITVDLPALYNAAQRAKTVAAPLPGDAETISHVTVNEKKKTEATPQPVAAKKNVWPYVAVSFIALAIIVAILASRKDTVTANNTSNTSETTTITNVTNMAKEPADASSTSKASQSSTTAAAPAAPAGYALTQPAAEEAKPVADTGPMKLQLGDQVAAGGQGVAAVTFSRDGSLIASGGQDRIVTIWDAKTLERIARIRDFQGSADALGFSPDGKRLIVGGSGLNLAEYDPLTGTRIQTLHQNSDTRDTYKAAVYLPDGKRVVTGGTKMLVDVWDTETGQHLKSHDDHTHHVWDPRLSRDGSKLASISWAGTAIVWQTGTPFKRTHTLATSSSNLYGVAFSYDGKHLYTGGNATKIYEYDLASKYKKREFANLFTRIIGLDASPNGQWLAAATLDNDTVHLVNAVTGKTIQSVKGDGHRATIIRFFPNDSNRFISAGYDGTMAIWNVKQMTEAEINAKVVANPLLIEQTDKHDHALIPPWQTFTATVDGTIKTIEVMANMYKASAGEFKVYEGKGLRGNVIHSGKWDAKSIGDAPWTVFELPAPVPVTKGSVYTWELTGANGIFYAKNDPYSGGQAASPSYDMCFRVHFAKAE